LGITIGSVPAWALKTKPVRRREIKKAVIFDVDGVLIDSERYYYIERQRFFAENGIKPHDVSFHSLVGIDYSYGWRLLFPDPKKRKLIQRRYEEYSRNHKIDYESILFPDVRGVLRELQGGGFKLGIASAGPRVGIDEFIHQTGLRSYFDVILSGEEVPKNKPEPMVYRECSRRLHVKAEDCVAIEDSPTGIAAAQSATIETWAIKPKDYSLDQSHADKILTSLSEITAYLAL
jgi:HAD superfamily hydrolase (TIGR01509 family)